MLLERKQIFLVTCGIFGFLSTTLNAQTSTPTPISDNVPETVFIEEIKLNVSAFDIKGDFVSGVKKDDIFIIEDDRLHQASSIRRMPANVLIVLDTGGEMRSVKGLKQTRKTAINLVNSLTDHDSVAILEYSDNAKIISEWTTDKEQTQSAIIKNLNIGKRSVFVEALRFATKFLRKSENENRHLVLITDGTDSFDRNKEREREMKRLMTTNINVHVISYTKLEIAKIQSKTRRAGGTAHPNPLPDEVIGGLPEPLRRVNKAPKFGIINLDKSLIRLMKKRKNDLVEGGKFLLELSENTNGLFILPESRDEMIEKAKLIAKVIDSNYVVTYIPKRPLSESPAGEIRTVEVSSKRSGLRISARRKLVVEKGEN